MTTSRRYTFVGPLALLALPLVLGCDKEPAAGASSTASSTAAGTAKTTAGASPAAAGSPRAPFESLKIVYTGKQDPEKFPILSITNESDKVVETVFIVTYAYDASGKQVGTHELSYNQELKPGATDPNVVAGGSKPWVPADATKFEAVYRGIRIKGGELVTDDKRAPAKRPMSGAK